MVLTIGSGDIAYLLMGNDTAGYQDLLRRFVSENRPYWNSFASPIDALRTGAILEYNYLNHLSDDYIFQKKTIFEEMDVFVSSIDFAKIENGEIVDFDELKTMFLPDFMDLIVPLSNEPEEIYLPIIKSKFKKNYNQIQCQMMCSKLDSANLVFMSVLSYDDENNKLREITPKDYVKFRIKRDEAVISKIKKEGKFFQYIKDNFVSKPKKQTIVKEAPKSGTLSKIDAIIQKGKEMPETELKQAEIEIKTPELEVSDNINNLLNKEINI